MTTDEKDGLINKLTELANFMDKIASKETWLVNRYSDISSHIIQAILIAKLIEPYDGRL